MVFHAAGLDVENVEENEVNEIDVCKINVQRATNMKYYGFTCRVYERK